MNLYRTMAPDLRRLFLAIARTTLASSTLAACASEHAGRQVADDDETSQVLPMDAATTDHDAAPLPPPQDAGTRVDGGRDAGAPPPVDGGRDSGVDGGPRDAGTGPTEAGGDGGGEGGWQSVTCGAGTAIPDGTVQTSRSIDYLGVYVQSSFASQDGGSAPVTGLAARSGVNCSGPSASATCQQELLTLISRQCATLPCGFAVVGQAGIYTRLETRDELLALLGSIDTAAEAVLLAAFDGHRPCHGIQSDPRDIGMELRSSGEGYELRTTWEDCGRPLMREQLSVSATGDLSVVSSETLKPGLCAIGRRPPGLCPDATEGARHSPAGSFLAAAAQLEHASIYAFYQLIRELSAHGAPAELRLSALDAMLDEVRHARDVDVLASAFGGHALRAEVRETALRSLFEIALDNATEGCVRETFGALLATYQAETAEDASVRAVMAQIAEDETRHATMSWKLMAWLSPQLSSDERARVHEAEAAAHAQLKAEPVPTLPDADRRALGLPSREVAAELLARMRRALVS